MIRLRFLFQLVSYNKKELVIILRHIADQIENGVTEDSLLDWKLIGEDEESKERNMHCGVPMAEIQNCMIDGEQLEIYKCRICGKEEESLWG